MTQFEEFRALGLSEEALEAIRAKGFETPSPIQKLTIPVLLDDGRTNDIIAQAQTGTGKTAAFGLPILEKLTPKKGATQALILVPTRELALQVTEELLSLNRKKLSIAPIYGGAAMAEQLRRLSKGIDIVVGTPGRILDHIRRGTLDLSELKFMTLDEADEMLNMGFIEDVEEILASSNEQRRIMLFSATMPKRIVDLSKRYMRDTEVLKVEAQEMTTELTDQIYFEVRESDKLDALTRIVDVEPDFYGIVFCRTKVGVDELVNRLTERGYAAEGLHGDVSQAQREKILRRFKKKLVNILVATDVAARGIDVNNLTHVINYSLPQDSESYVHRIGRTGRAGNTGTAITFISNSEYRQFGSLKRDIKVDIKKVAIPTAQDVIEIKKGKIRDDMAEIIESEAYDKYMEMAGEMLTNYTPEVALASLLKLAFKNDLEETSYPEIRSINVDRKGTARLFISIGKLDGYNPKKLSEMLKRECGLSDRKIDDIRVMDSYSFVTIPFSDARQAIQRLNSIQKGGRPIAELAQPKGQGGSEEGPHHEKPRSGYGSRAAREKSAAEGSGRGRKPEREEHRADDESGRGRKPAAARGRKAKPADDSFDAYRDTAWDAKSDDFDFGRFFDTAPQKKKQSGWGGKGAAGTGDRKGTKGKGKR